LFAKLIPVISIWELKVGEHPQPALTPQEIADQPLWKAAP
jgi:hypothetical protein